MQAGGGGPRLEEDRRQDQGTPSETNTRAGLGHMDTRIQLHTGTQTHARAHTHTHTQRHTGTWRQTHKDTQKHMKTWNRDSGGWTQTDRHRVLSHTESGPSVDLDLPWLEFGAQNTAPQLGSQGW